jgi:hypothetical protein
MSGFIVALMIVSSVAGLWLDGVYQEPDAVAALLRGYDLTTLVFAAPLLAAALLPAVWRSPRGQLLWIGALAYGVYTYASYVFGTGFNDLFLGHVALFSLSVFALIVALGTLDVAGVGGRFHPRTPARSISVVLLLLGVALATMWIFYSLRFAVTGQLPEEARLVVPTATTHLGYVLDLSLLIPAYLLAAVLLWRRAAWGFVLAAMLLISGALHQVAYLIALVLQANAQIPGASATDPGELPVAAAFLAGAALLLANCGRRTAG